MKKYLLGILGGAVLSCLIPACSMPAEPSAEPAGFGQVRISFASGPARTVIPAKTFERYVYNFTGTASDGTTQLKKYDSAGDEISTNGNNPVVSLEAGDWTVTVHAYADADDATTADLNNFTSASNYAASGTSATFTVTAGAVTPVTVELTGEVATGATGTFKYNIQYPAGVDTSASTFTMTSLSPTGTNVSLSSLSWGGTAVTGAESSVPAGFYLVQVELTWNGRKAGKTEVVHIYQNMTTEWGTADAPIRFDPADFARQPLSTLTTSPTADIKLYDGSSISGALQVGDIIKAVPNTSTPPNFNGGSVTYQWYRSDNAPSNPLSASPNTFQISGATDSIYVVDPADRGKYISVEVTWDNYIGSVFGTTTLPVKASFSGVAAFRTWLAGLLSNASTTYEVAFTGLDIGTLSLTNADLSGRNVSIDLSGLTGNNIAANAFKDCTTLTEITLPASLNNTGTIGANAFNGCTALTTVICLAVTPPNLTGNAVFPASFSSSPPVSVTIKVPASAPVSPGDDGPIISEYKAQWSAYASTITDQ